MTAPTNAAWWSTSDGACNAATAASNRAPARNLADKGPTTRDRLPTLDDERNYDEQHAERNELAALVKQVREHKRTVWRTVDTSEVLERVRLIDAPGQRFHELLQRPEFRAHRQKLDDIKQEAQHVATCMRRIKQRVLELCGREELGAHRARLEQAVKEADKAGDVTLLVEQLRGLLAPDERELLGLDHDNVTRAERLEEGGGLKLRRLLAEWGSPSFVCRNGIIADWNPVMAACTAGNAVPLTLGAGSASKATAMYSIKYMGKDSVNISASASVLHEAHRKVHDHPSSADDKCTAERTSKHFCQHVINHASMELEATQAAGVVLGIKSYGRSDDIDYHSAWDHVKVAAYAESGLLKQRPGLHDVALEDDSDMCRAMCATDKPCRSRVHPKAGQEGHCEGTCGRHKHLRPVDLRPRDSDGQHASARRDATKPPAASTGEGAESDAEIVVSDSDTEVDDDDLLARDNVDAEAAAGMAEGGPPAAAAGAAGGAPRRGDGPQRPQRDLLAFFQANGGATSGSFNMFKNSDGKPVAMCSAYNYAYRDSRLCDFNPIEFRRRFYVVVMDPEQAALYKLQASVTSFIRAWWRLEGRRGRAAAATRKFEARLEQLEQAGDWDTAAEYTAYKREQLQKKVTRFGYSADDTRPGGMKVFWTLQQLECIAWKASGGLNAAQTSPASPEGGIVFYWRFGVPSPHAVRYADLLLDRAVRYFQAWWRFSRSQNCHRHHRRRLQFVLEVRRRSWVRSVRRKRFVIAGQAWLDIKHSVAPVVRKRPCACYWLRPPHPLHDKYAILPRTKWGVLAFPGAPPPKEPSSGLDLTTRKGKARARNVALFYVSNFTPWSAFEPPTLEHDAWRQHCEELRQTASLGRAKWEDTGPKEQRLARRKERYVAAARLFDIENVMSGFRAPKVCMCGLTRGMYWRMGR